MDFRSVGVIGAGAWGTALAGVAARAGRETLLWGRSADTLAQRAAGASAGLTDTPLIRAQADLARAAGAGLLLCAVPAQATRAMLGALAPHLAPHIPVVLCAKGIEQHTGCFQSEIAAACLPGHPIAVLSGPSFAADVARGLPTAVTLAAADAGLARAIVVALNITGFRLYHTTDTRGVEIGGAAKNVLAIACGVAQARALGASAAAALVARGFAEMRRFGAAWGARPETLMGLSGLGDLVLTCASPQSRNFAFGLALGRGETPAGKLAEGVFSAPILAAMAARAGVDMPIAASVASIIAGEIGVDAAIDALLSRPTRAETA